TLTSKAGITAKDVAGRDVPGFDKVALVKVVVTNDRLVADLEFGAKKIKGEIAAFHPGTSSQAVLAMTLDRLVFSDLVPAGAASDVLSGIEVDGLTLVVVPPKGSGLKPDDAAIPAEIATNLKKVLADANKVDFTLKEGINLLAELDYEGSGPMKNFMHFVGQSSKKGIPLVGVMSINMFNTAIKGVDRFKGMDIGVPMPNINLAKLPGAFSFDKAEFKITDSDPLGNAGLWVGLVADLNADLMGKKLAFSSSIGIGKEKISLEAESQMKLPAPFGIEWIALKDLALSLDYDKKNRSGELKFTAIPDKPIGKSHPKISIDLQELNGKLAAGVLKIQEKVAFSDLPMLKGIPHADQFDFTFLEISSSGLSGGSLLHGQEVDAVIFEQNKKWTFAVSDNGGGKGFKFGRVMPALNHTPLADFHLNDAALIFSQADISEKLNKLPEVAQKVFTDIYGNADALVKIQNGITIAANFSPGNSSGFAAKGLNGIGIHGDVLLEGTVENIFGGKGSPGVDILVQVEQGPGGKKGASHTPKMAKFPGEVGFFVQYKGEELDVGLAADVVLHLPQKQTLDLVTKLELDINEKGFGVDIFMDLKGKWDRPFGIPGFDLEEVAIKFGIDMEGEAKFGFRGKCELANGAERIDVAAEMDFELDALGLPDGIAVRGKIKELGIPAIIDIAERMAGGGANILPPNDIPLPEFRDVVFAYATPGATDPQLGLVTDGFMLSGELFFMGRELGKVDLHAGKSGVKLKAEIDPIDLKVIKLDKNKMDFELGFTSLPKLEIDSKIEFLGAEQDVTVKFDKGMVNMEFEEKIGGGIWDSKINLGFGFDPAHSGVPDIFIEGEVKEDFFAWLRNQGPQKIRQFFNMLNEDFEKAKAKINNAEAVARSWNRQIEARKEVVQREKASADAAIHRAEDRARSVLNDANHAASEARSNRHNCHWYSAWHCAAEGYWWARYGVEYAAYRVAEGVLHAAQETVDHLPSELMDPQLDYLEGKQAIAMTALELAKLAIDGVEDADKWIESGLETLASKLGDTDALVIKEIFFEGDMDGMLKGSPLILSIDLSVFGKDLGMQMFAFKLTDPLFDVEQLAAIPLHMILEVFNKYLPKSLNKLMGPVFASINNELNKSMQKVKEELENVPGVNLPPDVQKALKAGLFINDGVINQRPNKDKVKLVRLASVLDANIQNDSGEQWMMLAQSAKPVTKLPKASSSKKGKSTKKMTHAERFEAYKEKRKNLLSHIVERNKMFGEGMVAFSEKQKAERAKNENDMFIAHTDVRVPPGEIFTERLLVARHSKLCLGQNGQGKTTFHPCNENTGGLLWSTKRKLVSTSGHVIPWNSAFAKKFPNRVYTQLIHNGECLTTPFQLQDYGAGSKKKHQELLLRVAKNGPKHAGAHLKLSACRNDGKGQLWKVVKVAHSINAKQHGFKLQERDSAYCLRPGSVKAHTKKQSKEVNGVFYPCSGIAHGTFELTLPNNDMPVWYDHNGVIKSDNGFCLDVPNDPFADSDQKGSAVYLKKCENDEYDRWDYVVEYDKNVKIINDFTGHCLYPYDQAEGKLSNAKHGQLVQRPCDGRYGQGWKMRVIPRQKWFQLEAIDSSKKATGTCMVPEKPDPKSGKVSVFVKSCNPATRGRWEFGHWKGTYEWTEWTQQNAMPSSETNLSTTYWIAKDSLKDNNRNGVCRVLIGDHNSGGSYEMYPGTWRGMNGTCSYVDTGGTLKSINPSVPSGSNVVVEVLSGLDIGQENSTGSWKNTSGGIPVDTTGQNAHPPKPKFSAFLAGGNVNHAPLYLCRVKNSTDQTWRYGYQTISSRCTTDTGTATMGSAQSLVFTTVKNTSP
ncbi:MAG: RICIN domain-containing protein, partial [Nitrospinaceae bacterium]